MRNGGFKVLIFVGIFGVGVILGIIIDKVYDYHKSLKEFNKRQERYKRMI